MKHISVLAIAVLCTFACSKSDKTDKTDKEHSPGPTAGPTVKLALSKQTVALVKKVGGDKLSARLFFPKDSAAKRALRDYFARLANQSGHKIAVAAHDAKVEPRIARSLRVRKNGTVIMYRGDVRRTMFVGTDTKAVPYRGDWFDKTLRGMLVDAKPRGRLYVVDGLDTRDVTARKQLGYRTFKRIADAIGFKLRALPRAMDKIPADAAMVALIGPEKKIPQPLQTALRRYITRGGRLLLATYGGRMTTAETLLDDMDLAYHQDIVIDPKHMAKTNPPTPALLRTSKLAKHPVWKHLKGRDRQMIFPHTGALRRSTKRPTIRREFEHRTIAHSEATAFADTNKNGKRDAGEKLGEYPLVVAVSGPNGFRAIVLGSSALFTDAIAAKLKHVQYFFDGAIRWLGESREPKKTEPKKKQ